MSRTYYHLPEEVHDVDIVAEVISWNLSGGGKRPDGVIRRSKECQRLANVSEEAVVWILFLPREKNFTPLELKRETVGTAEQT